MKPNHKDPDMRLAWFAAALLSLACSHPQKPTAARTLPEGFVLTQSVQEGRAACVLLGRWTFVACAAGYKAGGGTLDKTSPVFQDAAKQCSAAAQKSFDRCQADELVNYAGKHENVCGDIAEFIGDNLPKQWRAAGQKDFQDFCDAEQAKQKAQDESGRI